MLAWVANFLVIDGFFNQTVSLALDALMLSVLKEAEGIRNRLMKIMLHIWMNEYCYYEVLSSKIYKSIEFLLLIIHSHF